jgi:hypothetical protein
MSARPTFLSQQKGWIKTDRQLLSLDELAGAKQARLQNSSVKYY